MKTILNMIWIGLATYAALILIGFTFGFIAIGLGGSVPPTFMGIVTTGIVTIFITIALVVVIYYTGTLVYDFIKMFRR